MGGLSVVNGDVLRKGAGEQKRLLKHHPDALPQVVGADIPDIHPVDPNLSLASGELIQLVQKHHKGAFAAAGAAQNAKRGPGRDAEAHIVQHLGVLLIGKGDVVKYDLSPNLRRQAAAGVLFLRGLHDGTDAVEGDAGLAHVGDHAAEHAHRPGHHGTVGEKREIGTGAHPAPKAEQRTEDHGEQDLKPGENVPDAPESGEGFGQLHPHRRVEAVLGFKAILFIAFAAESPDDANAGEVLLRDGGEKPFVLIAIQKGLPDPAVEVEGIENDHRNRQHGDQRQVQVHPQHEAQGKQQQNYDPDQVRHLFGQKVLQRLDVRGTALDDVPGAVVHVPGIGKPLQMGKEPVAHGLHKGFGGDGLADLIAELRQNLSQCHEEERRRQKSDLALQRPLSLCRSQKACRPDGEPIGRCAADHMVHRNPDDLRRDKIGQGAQRRSQHAQKKEKTTAPEKVPEHPSIIKGVFCGSVHTGRSFSRRIVIAAFSISYFPPEDKSGRGRFSLRHTGASQSRNRQHRRKDDAACAGIFMDKEDDHTRPAKACSKSAMMSSGSSSPMEMRTRPSEMPEALSSSEV